MSWAEPFDNGVKHRHNTVTEHQIYSVINLHERDYILWQCPVCHPVIRKLNKLISIYSVLRCMGCLKTGRQTGYGHILLSNPPCINLIRNKMHFIFNMFLAGRIIRKRHRWEWKSLPSASILNTDACQATLFTNKFSLPLVLLEILFLSVLCFFLSCMVFPRCCSCCLYDD